MILTHWTCSYGAAEIRRTGVVRPMPQPLFGGLPLSWWTDLEGSGEPIRLALGLTRHAITCDRMTTAFTPVSDEPAIVPWLWYARQHHLSPTVLAVLHAGGAMPRHWWVAFHPVAVAERRTDAQDQ